MLSGKEATSLSNQVSRNFSQVTFLVLKRFCFVRSCNSWTQMIPNWNFYSLCYRHTLKFVKMSFTLLLPTLDELARIVRLSTRQSWHGELVDTGSIESCWILLNPASLGLHCVVCQWSVGHRRAVLPPLSIGLFIMRCVTSYYFTLQLVGAVDVIFRMTCRISRGRSFQPNRIYP